ncbi:butyrate kinase [Deinococcus sp. Leaf326]|uniref:butyrate kinase n=1 Tax=Deinococcus sp. Leaf326 TaxID=1736338 RepID=UPI000700C85E|nr:butyrate kinase [Deinococcus sp. Leaf326]KQR28045.1 butyrate kinase [Deinococcus sp. Leaf326]
MIAHVVNPGSGGVKLACATIEPSLNPALPGQLQVTLTRAELPLSEPPTPGGVSGPALDDLAARLLELTRAWPRPDVVVGRGGEIGRVPAGTYRLTPELAERALNCGRQDLPANLGGPLALRLAQAWGVPGFIVDPQSVDELLPQAQLTGVAGLRRTAQFHALNARAVARRAAYETGKKFADARVVVAHLGATTSVTAFDQGRAIDTTGSGAGGGPLGARQSGPLSAGAVLRLRADYGDEELLRLLTLGGGFQALTGSADLRELEAREMDDPAVQAATAAFVHQVCKAVGEQCGALPGRPDAVALTGGIARWDSLVDRIERRLAWTAPVIVVPGELELEALAEGAGRVLFGLEGLREWSPSGVTVLPPAPTFPQPAGVR